MDQVKVGFLPLYIKLYDDGNPDARIPMVQYMEAAISMLQSEGLNVIAAPVCRIKPEFAEAAELFNKEAVDVIVTMHLAYSPSLESIDAIMSVDAPVVVLDTTLRYDYVAHMKSSDVTPNHGIHGVQDMCNLLKRRGKPYFVEAGHLLHGDVVARVAGLCRAAKVAKAFRAARIGTIGGAFAGMGDFFVSPADMKKQIGAQVVEFDFNNSKKYVDRITEAEIDNEILEDSMLYAVEVKNKEAYREAVRAGLAVRRWQEEEKLTALTANFLAFNLECGLPKMPFLELSKMMTRGIGYAGEGDTLTAGLVGALLSVYPDTTFTEMFCPDWKENVVFMSHMGEMNLDLSCWKPVLADKPFQYGTTGSTVAAYGCMRKGNAVLVNLAPLGDSYNLVLVPVEMKELGQEFGQYRDTTEGWMKPPLPLEQFLPAYSEAGGTHHSALIYNAKVHDLEVFGKMMGFHVVTIA